MSSLQMEVYKLKFFRRPSKYLSLMTDGASYWTYQNWKKVIETWDQNIDVGRCGFFQSVSI